MMTREQSLLFALQFITHQNERIGYEESARLALEGGCRWVQLRMKEAPLEEVKAVGLKIKELCKKHEAVFIVDDHVELCKELGADGVHLGKNDMKPAEARKILGDKYIIGGTCNTFSDIEAVCNDVDYVGCGPFRFTQTKKNLAPVLGLDGYREIVWQCRSAGINVPIVAIGGITRSDIEAILEAGPNGIALSGSILNAANPVEETQLIVNMLESRIKS